MQMRRYDVESWMRRRGLPEEMRKYVALCYDVLAYHKTSCTFDLFLNCFPCMPLLPLQKERLSYQFTTSFSK
jgi:hypothetical protein